MKGETIDRRTARLRALRLAAERGSCALYLELERYDRTGDKASVVRERIIQLPEQ